VATSVLNIRRRRPIGEPEGRGSSPSPAVTILDGTAGAGRICGALLELGVELSGVRQAAVDPDATPADLDAIDLGQAFDRVALGSHLVNLPEAERRAAWLRLAARHLAPAGDLLLEHHPVDWAETAEPTAPMPGAAVGMEEVRRHPPFVSAVSTFDVGGRYVRQPFTARVLSEDELPAVLGEVGLEVRRRLSPTWLEAARTTIEA
jgi:hypothetical protein